MRYRIDCPTLERIIVGSITVSQAERYESCNIMKTNHVSVTDDTVPIMAPKNKPALLSTDPRWVEMAMRIVEENKLSFKRLLGNRKFRDDLLKGKSSQAIKLYRSVLNEETSDGMELGIPPPFIRVIDQIDYMAIQAIRDARERFRDDEEFFRLINVIAFAAKNTSGPRVLGEIENVKEGLRSVEDHLKKR